MKLNKKITKEIQILVKEIREENDIKNEIIRDDVFSILQALECVVLYYPLDGEDIDGCDGCHIEKPVDGKMEQFVFINTNNTRERQAFSAAHELGHIWKVDDRLRNKCPEEVINCEEVVNRFAAELLMPQELFNQAKKNKLKEMAYVGPTITDTDLVKLIAYLMNYFFVPFKAVVLRFIELDSLSLEDSEKILRHKESGLLKEIIKAEQYTRLGIVNQLRSFDNLMEYLVDIEAKKLFNETKIKNIRNEFEIKKIDRIGISNDSIVFEEVYDDK